MPVKDKNNFLFIGSIYTSLFSCGFLFIFNGSASKSKTFPLKDKCKMPLLPHPN
nr:MAG TPA: hypothetical protein [Caudoviricetes sp.]